MADDYSGSEFQGDLPIDTGQYPNGPVSYDTNWGPAGRDWYTLEGDGGTMEGGGTLTQNPNGTGGGGQPASNPGLDWGITPPNQGGNVPYYTNSPSSSPGGTRPSSPSFPQGPTMNPRGTPPSPAQSSQFSGPGLPAPDFSRLMSILADPSKIKNDPAYQWLTTQGMQALNRTAAGRKMALSGNAATAAMDWGQGNAYKYFNQVINDLIKSGQLDVSRYGASRFSQGSSVGANPGTQGEAAAQDLIPFMQQLFQQSARPGAAMPSPRPISPVANPSYAGIQPNTYSRLHDELENLGLSGINLGSGFEEEAV